MQIALERQLVEGTPVLNTLLGLGMLTTAEIEEAARSLGLPDDAAMSASTPKRVKPFTRERRVFRRMRIPDSFRIEIDSRELPHADDELFNLSLGGLGYATTEPNQVGVSVPVKIESKSGVVLSSTTRVVFVGKGIGLVRVGTEFNRLNPEALLALYSLLEEIWTE